MIYFSSDWHIGHKKIIEYSVRPFRHVDAMHEEIVDRYNAVVKPEDTLYHLGDFSFWNKEKSTWFLSRLNGTKILVRGNHDRSITANLEIGFKEVHNSLFTEMDGKKIFMRHIPPRDMDHHKKDYKPEFLHSPPEYYDYWLCGHVHQMWFRKENVINVGVDVNDFTPRTLAQLLAK